MNKAFRLSLLYLLMIIPQHGNSPIPRMESWIEMDQGDGFVDRDLTSSLTGAENFGSAHKNYQNALIRKKQRNMEDDFLHDGTVDKFSGRIPDRVQRKVSITPNFVQKQFTNYGLDDFLRKSGSNGRIYKEPVSGMNSYQDQRCRIQLSNSNVHGTNSGFGGTFDNSDEADLIASPLTAIKAKPMLTDDENLGDEDKAVASSSRLTKCYLGETEKFEAEPRAGDVSSDHEGDDGSESDYIAGNEESRKRVKSGSNEDYASELPIEDGDEGDRQLLRYNMDEEEDLGMDDGDYYGDAENAASARDALDDEYTQINPNRMIYKREGRKMHGENSVDDVEDLSRGSLTRDAEIQCGKVSRSDNFLRAEAPKESREITKADSKGKLRNTNGVWTTNSNVEAKDVEKELRNSERGFENKRIFQRNSEVKPEYYSGKRHRKRSINGRTNMRRPKEKRNKREDEDEQKNMKTGTDEGGGEYEDEEGKGHNDEEEYYEEGEISTGDITSDTRFSDHFSNGNLYKRESGKDEEEKENKEQVGNSDVSFDEYRLNLENAPVEHEDNPKKSSMHEGKNKEKIVARRGMKIWDEWGKWSPCSVTCGVGRKTRWRHCIGGGCARGEKEALIKKCTYPAC